ncbi:MAG: DsbA family protein [Flavobacteriales bacterium]|nr:DsbA family protein [Flavobacteriales bacterium]
MRLLYFYDALCGWCYGFQSVIKELHQEYSPSLEFEVISGGMVLGSRTGPINEVAGYISHAYKRVEGMTGERFGKGFIDGTLEEGSMVFDSFPPAKALRIFKEFRPHGSLAFATEIQKAIYFEGYDPNDPSLYVDLIKPFDISQSDFKILWNTSDYDVRTQEEFLFAQQLNVSAYPSVFFESDSKYHKIAEGYTDYSVLAHRLQHVMKIAETG